MAGGFPASIRPPVTGSAARWTPAGNAIAARWTPGGNRIRRPLDARR